MAKVTVSFRDQTFGKIAAVCSDGGLECAHTNTLLSYFAGALVAYREEGVELSPSVIVCADIREILRAIPGAVKYEIGIHDLAPDAGARILKQCGTLATGTWAIYVERTSDRFAFGIIGYPATPLTLGLADAISLVTESFAVLIRKSTQNTVEIIGRKQKHLSLVFSTVRDDEAPNPAELIGKLAESAANQIEAGTQRDEFVAYLSNLLGQVLDRSHGAILAVVRDGNVSAVEQIRDYVALAPAVSFFDAYSRFREAQTADALVALQSLEGLLLGLVRSDGVLLFNETGAVVAYRGFYRPEGHGLEPSQIGGARRRAFDGICAGLSGNVAALLFRSQDGLTIFEGARHD